MEIEKRILKKRLHCTPSSEAYCRDMQTELKLSCVSFFPSLCIYFQMASSTSPQRRTTPQAAPKLCLASPPNPRSKGKTAGLGKLACFSRAAYYRLTALEGLKQCCVCALHFTMLPYSSGGTEAALCTDTNQTFTCRSAGSQPH